MTYEKLTYSGTDCNNYLYFSFYADIFDTDIITRELGIEPTSVIIKNDPVPKSTRWMYKIEAGTDINLEKYLKLSIDILVSKIHIINQLKNDYNLNTRLQLVIDIDIRPDASTPYFGFDKRTIDFLSQTGTEVEFDLYKANTMGLLKEQY